MDLSLITVVNLMMLVCLLPHQAEGGEGTVSPADAVNYLRKYGHAPEINHMTGGLMTQDALTNSVLSFQRFAGLPMTGELDGATMEKMQQKRCGNSDIAGTENARRKKRYALQGSKWPKKDLTYKISRYTSDLSRSEINREIAAAFKWWSDESGLTFRQVSHSSRSDIDIKFAPGAHGDGDPFDGPGNTLAHAYFPVYGGDAHFDEAETWLLQSERGGTRLQIVAAHEFGHSLGLSHSDQQKALMAPFYNPRVTGLHVDDVIAIRRLYGKQEEKPSVFPSRRPTTKRPVTTTTKRTTTTNAPPVGACNGRFEAITRLSNGSTYAFLGKLFWRLNNQGVDKGFPQSIKDVWGVKGPIDAALTYNKETDLFMGRNVYRYNGVGEKIRGFPQPISTVYRGIPSHIDAAFQWSGNGKLYFVKGQQYWRYNIFARRADPGYPRPMSVWQGLPEQIDAAFQWYGRTYFFSDAKYYRLDDSTIKVAQLKEHPYPRRTDEWWLGCKDNTLRQSGSSLDGSVDEDNAGGSATLTFPASRSALLLVSTISLLVFNRVLA